jgi:hypothetical protein
MLLPASFGHDRIAQRYTLCVNSSDVAFAYVHCVRRTLSQLRASSSCMFHGAENSRLLSKLGLDCGCHASHVDTGRWRFFAQPDHIGVFHYVVDCLDFMMI